MQGWRKNMEDAHLCEINIGNEISLFGVFDGHGGKFVSSMRGIGQEVAIFSKQHFKEYLKTSAAFPKADYAQALKDAFMHVDETLKSPEGRKELQDISASINVAPAIYPRSEGEDLAAGVGCTACVALLTRSEVYVANAGDSRSVLSRKGAAVAMSEDHKPELEKERKRVEKAGGSIEDGRINGVLNLSRSLGDLEYKRDKKLSAAEQMITCVPDVRVEKLSADTEFLIVACDGVWDCLTNQKATALVRERIWNTASNKPVKTKISKVIADILDKILAVDLDNPGTISAK